MDVIVSEYGLLENDILFIEQLHEDEWLFELDMNNPKYFDSRHHIEASSEYPNYQRYWENMNYRSFSTNSRNVPPYPEYSKITQCLVQIELATKCKKSLMEDVANESVPNTEAQEKMKTVDLYSTIDGINVESLIK